MLLSQVKHLLPDKIFNFPSLKALHGFKYIFLVLLRYDFSKLNIEVFCGHVNKLVQYFIFWFNLTQLPEDQ